MSDFNQFDTNENNEIQEKESLEVTEELSEEGNTDPDQGGAFAATEIVSSPKQSKFAMELLDYIEIFVVAISVVILLFSFVFRICSVEGESMEDTLFHGEALVVSNLFYTPERDDIIVFHQTGRLNEPVVKRVIATAGETVRIQYIPGGMKVTVTDVDGNETLLDEEYIKYIDIPLYLSSETYHVGEGQIFVMGDNRNHSKDSRHSDIGLVDERRVLGKVLFRLSPISRFGTVD